MRPSTGGSVVGGAGAFPFRMTAPGARLVDCAGVTVVGVMPTHRRQGVLTRMMRAQLIDERERGRPLAALYASEEPIYGRFGYGLATTTGRGGDPARLNGGFIRPFAPRGRVPLVPLEEAYAVCAPIYRQVARRTPGMVERSKVWWEVRQLRDDPEHRDGWGEKNVACSSSTVVRPRTPSTGSSPTGRTPSRRGSCSSSKPRQSRSRRPRRSGAS